MDRATLQKAKDTITNLKAQGKTLRKVWRCRVFATELVDCGFKAEALDDGEWMRILRPLLLAKGIPAMYLRPGTDVGIAEANDGKSFTLEFE